MTSTTDPTRSSNCISMPERISSASAAPETSSMILGVPTAVSAGRLMVFTICRFHSKPIATANCSTRRAPSSTATMTARPAACTRSGSRLLIPARPFSSTSFPTRPQGRREAGHWPIRTIRSATPWKRPGPELSFHWMRQIRLSTAKPLPSMTVQT